MIRIAIIDDDKNDRDDLLLMLERYFAETGGSYSTDTFDEAVGFITGYSYSYDLIILDIDMPQLSGIDAAKVLRKKNKTVTLMFVTNMPQYALEGYAVDAIDYAIKPLSYADFRVKMKKAERYIAQNTDTFISLHTSDGIVRLAVSDITYIESRLHYLHYHTSDKVYTIRAKLSDVEEDLLPYHFARSGVSYLINLSHLSAIEGNELVVSGEHLPVSRRKRAELMSAFTRYMGGMK